MKSYLTKSKFVAFTKCSCRFWLEMHHPEVLPEVSDWDKGIIAQGDEVDALAVELFPNGVSIEGFNKEGFENTQKAILDGAEILYQPTAFADGLSARGDILVKNGDAWDIYEVKSSSGIDKDYYSDLAFQRIVFERAGIPVGKTVLLHVNGNYLRKGELEMKKFFHEEDLTGEVLGLLDTTKREIEEVKSFLLQTKELTAAELQRCCGKKDCGAQSSWLNSLGAYEREELLQQFDPTDAKALLERKGVEVNGLSAEFLQHARYETPEERWPAFVDKEAVRGFINELSYPLYFLDYETINRGIPPFDGAFAWQQIPFQFSLMVVDAPGAAPRQYDYLETEDRNPVPGLLAALAEAMGPEGSVISWNMSFEKKCNVGMAGMSPSYAKLLRSVNDRMRDLGDPFRKNWYVDPRFGGRWSLKVVLPVLGGGLSYKDLEIQEGGAASASWAVLTSGDLPAKERKKLYDDMIAYCQLDVYGMVKILKALEKAVN